MADRTCTQPDCGRPHKGHGLCIGHLQQRNKGQALRPLIYKVRPTLGRTCGWGSCDKPHYGHGLCVGHFRQRRYGRPLHELRPTRPVTCTFDSCDKPHFAHGLCKGHAAQRERGRALHPLWTRVCADCGTSFPSRSAHRCNDCATYPMARRRQRTTAARKGWSPTDYADRRTYVNMLRDDPCSYCGAADAGEVDHIVSMLSGGGDGWDNLTAACRSCNASKMHRPLLMFLLVGR